MTSDDLKKQCAKEALQYIKTNTVIGLGGGSTIAHLINYIRESGSLEVNVVTPSAKTKLLCLQNGLTVLHTCAVDRIAVAFDGCDEVDEELNALKSGGGIHTREKLIAAMAEDYILLVDDTKFVKTLTFRQPVVLEILEDSLKYVERIVTELGGKPAARCSAVKDGFIRSDDGNILVDVFFEKAASIDELAAALKNICGVVDTSLFVNIVTKAIIAGDQGIRTVARQKNIIPI